MDLVLTERLRSDLKKPFGELFDSVDEIKEQLHSKYIISVGDKISEALIERGILPHICIFDGKTKRVEIDTPNITEFEAVKVRIRNPPGHITREAFTALEKAISSEERTKVFVEGEEDLLSLAAASLAPEGAVVLYGQPDEGVVVIEVNANTKQRIEKIFCEMSKISQNEN